MQLYNILFTMFTLYYYISLTLQDHKLLKLLNTIQFIYYTVISYLKKL